MGYEMKVSEFTLTGSQLDMYGVDLAVDFRMNTATALCLPTGTWQRDIGMQL